MLADGLALIALGTTVGSSNRLSFGGSGRNRFAASSGEVPSVVCGQGVC